MKKRRKFTTAEKVTLTVLIIIMAAVIGTGAFLIIDNVNTANREATNTTHTTVKIETTAVPDTTAENAATEKTVSKTEKKKNSSSASSSSTDKSTKKSSTPKTTKSSASKKSDTSTKSTAKSTADDNVKKISIVTPEKNTSHKSNEKCVINGTTCYVGDTISVTLNLKTAKILENYQGYTSFDSDYLTCKSVKGSGIVNNKGNNIYYNASVITGLDFTSGGTIYTAKFTVNKAGSTEIKNTLEVVTDINDKIINPSSAKDTVKIYS